MPALYFSVDKEMHPSNNSLREIGTRPVDKTIDEKMSRETDLKLNDDTEDKITDNDKNSHDDEVLEAELLMDDDDKISARDVRLALCEEKEEWVIILPNMPSDRSKHL